MNDRKFSFGRLTRSRPLARLLRNLRLRQILLAASQAARISLTPALSHKERGNRPQMAGNGGRSLQFGGSVRDFGVVEILHEPLEPPDGPGVRWLRHRFWRLCDAGQQYCVWNVSAVRKRCRADLPPHSRTLRRFGQFMESPQLISDLLTVHEPACCAAARGATRRSAPCSTIFGSWGDNNSSSAWR